MNAKLIFCILLAGLGSSRAAENPPPVSPLAPVLQYGAGAALGVLGAAAGAYIGGSLEHCPEQDPDDEPDFCGLGGALIGAAVGHSVGTVAGVSLIGLPFNGKGFWIPTLLGNLAGVSFFALNYSLGEFLFGGNQAILGYAVLLPLFTTSGYYMGRYWDLHTGISGAGDGVAMKLQTTF